MKLQQAFDEHRRSFTGALLTTYVFNSDYFEGTLLPILRRKSLSGDTVICTDAGAYQDTLNDDDVQPSRAGDDYYLCPMRLSQGRFHPKVHLFGDEDRAVGFVGSANLTYSAFDQNREVVTQFDVTNTDEGNQHPDIHGLAGIHRFYRSLLDHPSSEAMGETVRDTAAEILEATEWVTEADEDLREGNLTTILHNLEQSLLDQVESRLNSRDESIERVDIVAPFYGESLAVPESFTDRGISTTLWLQQEQTQIGADALQSWAQNNETANVVLFDEDRYVHGKVFLLQTEGAMYCLAGSPNASRAAMLGEVNSDESYANIEVAVLRRVTDTEYYDYLLDELATNELEGIGLERFIPQTVSDYQPSEQPSEEMVDLLSVNFTWNQELGTGTIHGRVRIAEPIAENAQFELSLHPTVETEPIEFSFSNLTSETDADRQEDTYSFSRRIKNEQYLNALSNPTKVTPLWNGNEGSARWLAIESRELDREAEAAADDDGVDSVWRTVHDLFLGDDQVQADRMEFLHALATQMGGRNQQEEGHVDGPEMDDTGGLSEGISLPTYSGSSSTGSPASQIGGYYETWVSQLHELRNKLLYSDVDTEEVLTLAGSRLAEMNRTNTWLEITRRESQARQQDLDDFPTELPREYTARLYSETEPGFSDNTSVAGQFVADARRELTTPQERRWLREEIGANIIFGKLVAERLLIDNEDEFKRYYGSDFDELLRDCLSIGGAQSGGSVEDEMSEALWAQLGDLPETLQRSSVSRRPPSEFHDERSAKRYVKSVVHDLSLGTE